MEIQINGDCRYGMIDTYLKGSMDNRYIAGIKIPMNNWNAREELAKSILLTVYKLNSGSAFIEFHPFDAFEVGKHDEIFNTIDICQTMFKNYIKNLPNGIYSVNHIKVVRGRLKFFNQHNFSTREPTEELIKAATIVEGMYHYITSGKFTDKCLKLIEEYQALQILKG